MTPKEKLEKFKKEKPNYITPKGIILLIVLIIIFRGGGPFIFLILNGGIYKKKKNEFEQQLAGYEGEAKAQEILEILKNKYGFRIFSNITLEKLNAEIDFVVVGEKTLNVIEIKNSRGEFRGLAESKFLKREKISRQGKKYTEKFYNPIKQVKTHVFKLSHFLKKNGIEEWINHKVAFVNPEASVLVHYDELYNSRELMKMLEKIINEDAKKEKKKLYKRNEICSLLTRKGIEIL